MIRLQDRLRLPMFRQMEATGKYIPVSLPLLLHLLFHLLHHYSSH
jgi:hypothetical protein